MNEGLSVEKDCWYVCCGGVVGDSIEHWGLVTFISGLLPNSCYRFVSDFENLFFFFRNCLFDFENHF